MILEEAINITNKIINERIANILLKELLETVEYANYTLFDLINFFKIRRMRELDIINSLCEKELFSYYRKYNTKVKELEVYKNTEFESDILKDLERSYEILSSYGIEADKNKELFHIEDIVNIDILQNSINEMKIYETTILKEKMIDDINDSFAKKILVTYIPDISFNKIYNYLKIQLLAEQNYINKNNTELVTNLYNRFLETKDFKLYKELSKDPYRLIFGNIKFDFVTYIDYMIKKDYIDKKENSDYLNKVMK